MTDTQKKEMTVLQIRVEKQLKDKFTEYCRQLGTKPSDELRRYMTLRSNELKKD